MINYAITFLATLVGYIVTVACALAGTMALTAAAPRLVLADHRMRAGFKLLYEGLWFISVTLGAFATSRVGMHASRLEQQLVLTGALLFVLWRNTWEARQRGVAHQIFISLVTVAGVMLGFAAEAKLATL